MSYLLAKNQKSVLESSLFSDYSKRKLHCLSRSYEELARLYEQNQTMPKGYENRRDLLFRKQLEEDKKIFSTQLKEISGAVSEVADSVIQICYPARYKQKQLNQYLKKIGIIVKDIAYICSEQSGRQIRVIARQSKQNHFTAKEFGDFLSVYFNRRLVPCLESATVLQTGFCEFLFQDEPAFSILHGIARRTKSGEMISGDNYSIDEYTDGNITYMIADGCGSGRDACADSQAVIEFMEKFMESGFVQDKAFHMVNAALSTSGENKSYTTLDLCTVHLHTGEAEFLKAGCASSFCKRGNKVQEISCDTLPLGTFANIYPISQSIQLMDQDMIIMVSDGVTDCFEVKNGYNKIIDVIAECKSTNPKEFSEYLLRYACNCQGEQIRDDMTVIVMGVWNE